MTTQIQDTTNTIYALARQGGTETGEYKEGLARVGQLFGELEKNPAYGFPAARVKSELERIKSQAFGEGVVGEVDRTYTRRGKAEAQKYLTDTILNNPALNLSNSERASLYSSGLARLQYLDGDPRTEAEIAAGQPPSYPVVIKAPNGMFMPLQDAQGRVLRFRGDEAMATATIRAEGEAQWRQTQGSQEARRRLEADAVRKRDARAARRAGGVQ